MTSKFLAAAVCCLPLSVLAQKGFTIRGKVGELNAPAMAYLTYTQGDVQVKDSVLMKKGSFSFKGSLVSPTMAVVFIKHDTITRPKNARADDLYFYLENSNITLTAKDSVEKAVVKGSVTNDESIALNKLQQPFRDTARAQQKRWFAVPAEARKDSAFQKMVNNEMNGLQAAYDSANRVWIAAHPNSYIALQTFAQVELAYNFNPDTAAARFTRLSPALQASVPGQKVAARIETGKKTMTGVMAMDFTEKDTTGKAVKLTDFRGKYVLVDFWASWCKPCRAENPNLLKAYTKFKEKNFTILGVSLDDENGRRAWLGAVAKDSLPWTQVSELAGFKAKSAVQYGVTAIPTNFLVDPSGKIIARNLRGADLEKKLEELFRM